MNEIKYKVRTSKSGKNPKDEKKPTLIYSLLRFLFGCI